MSPSPTIRHAMPHEADAVIGPCLEAFRDEAVLSWLIPDPDERGRRAGAVFDTPLRGAIMAGQLLVAVNDSGEVVGASMWGDHGTPQGSPAEPAGPDDSAPDDSASGGGDAGGGDAGGGDAPSDGGDATPETVTDPVLRRLVHVEAVTTAVHPTAPHVFLGSMATVPEHRGRGVGSALLRHGLAEADQRGLPTYLEASTPRNRALYERFGFRPCATPITLPDGGPTLQPMWREVGGGS